MALYRCGGGGSSEIKQATLTGTATSWAQSAKFDMTGISGYQNLTLWQNLFVNISDLSILNSKQSATYAYRKPPQIKYEPSTGTLTISTYVAGTEALGGINTTANQTVTVYYFT